MFEKTDGRGGLMLERALCLKVMLLGILTAIVLMSGKAAAWLNQNLR